MPAVPRLSFTCTHETTSASQPISIALADLPRLAQLASQDTGWPISGRINVRVVTPTQASQLIQKDLESQLKPGFNSSDWKQIKTVSRNSHQEIPRVLGMYLCGLKEILVVHDPSTDPKITADNFKSTIYHELIHLAQHQNQPAFFNYIANYLQTYYRAQYARNSDYAIASRSLEMVNKMKTVIEGQPTYLQYINDARYFPYKHHIEVTSLNSAEHLFLAPVINQYQNGFYLFAEHTPKAPQVNAVFTHDFVVKNL